MICVVMPQWSLPSGFDYEESDLLIRLSPGYPDVAPDMWWFSPPVRLADGKELPPPVFPKLISGVVGSAGRDTSIADSGSQGSMALRAFSP